MDPTHPPTSQRCRKVYSLFMLPSKSSRHSKLCGSLHLAVENWVCPASSSGRCVSRLEKWDNPISLWLVTGTLQDFPLYMTYQHVSRNLAPRFSLTFLIHILKFPSDLSRTQLPFPACPSLSDPCSVLVLRTGPKLLTA